MQNAYTMNYEYAQTDRTNDRLKQKKGMLATLKNQIQIDIDVRDPKSLALIQILFSVIEKELVIFLPEIKIFVSTYLKDYANLAKVS